MLGLPVSKDRVFYWHYTMGTPADCGWTEEASAGSSGYGEMQENGYLLTAKGASYSAYMIIPPIPVWDGNGEIEAVVTLNYKNFDNNVAIGFCDGSSGCFCQLMYNNYTITVVSYEGTARLDYTDNGLSKDQKAKIRAVVENGKQSLYINDIPLFVDRPLSTRSATRIRLFPQNGGNVLPATVLVESIKVTLREE